MNTRAVIKSLRSSKMPSKRADEFSILARNYKNRMKRIAESFFVKDKKSNLNIQRDTFKLQLFK